MQKYPEKSLEIKMMCLEKKIRQREIVAMLRENGYPKMNDALFSNILSGSYVYQMASEILEKAYEYVTQK